MIRDEEIHTAVGSRGHFIEERQVWLDVFRENIAILIQTGYLIIVIIAH